jgi:hypothetical protein
MAAVIKPKTTKRQRAFKTFFAFGDHNVDEEGDHRDQRADREQNITEVEQGMALSGT